MIGRREAADEPLESPTAAGRVIAFALPLLAPSERYSDIAIRCARRGRVRTV